MIKEKITYTDFNGEDQTEIAYFNLSRPEIMELELSKEGGLTNFLHRIIEEEDVKEIYQILKEIILLSYGIKSDDGKRFKKSKEISDSFEQSPAFDEFIFSLIADAKKAADFVNGIVPKKVLDEVEKEAKKNEGSGLSVVN